MKILIIGADGQLGTDLAKVIPKEEQIPTTIFDIDITDKLKTLEALKKYSPDVVINTAAYHNVDACEMDAAPAFAVNFFGVKNLAQACREIDCVLVHISTDYVFDGKKSKPYVETDCPNPQSVYAISKLAGEQCVRSMLDKYFIVRSTGLYGVAGCMGKGGVNFVENMIKRATTQPELSVVVDEVLAPTYTTDLASKIYQLIQTKKYGLYHIVNHGQCSWYDFTCEIFKLLNRKIAIFKTDAKAFKALAKRPKYSVLKNAALGKLGMDDLRPWQDALSAYLLEKGYYEDRPSP
ncbi:MAG: dTDP-4-dehydrorhamnose reductase [Candidatus Saganbacteria bacterium]|nr:dTDP-4-dehydrorhamnose reductase [Candidatus Saganbacteria bacterium]